MIATPREPNLPVPVPESFHEQTNEELTENDIKRMDADDQAIQTILLGLPEDVYAVVDSCETAKEIWEHVRQMMKGSDIGEQEKKAKLFNEWEKSTSTDRESIESYYHRFMQLMNDLKRNKHFPENIAANLKFLNNLQPEWKRHVTIVHQTKNLHETDFTQIYDFLKMNQDENFIQPPMTSLEDINDPTEAMNATFILFAKAFQLTAPTNNNQRTSSNPRSRIANQNGTGNVVAARAERFGNGNQARCYKCRGLSHIARNCTARPRRMDAAYLHTQLLIAQKEEAGIQLQAEKFDLMAVAGDLDEIEEVNANCILMANLQHASTSGTQLDKAPVYDTDGSAENDNHVTSVAPSMVQSGGTIETSYAPNEETRAHQETVYLNLVDQVAQVNMINFNMRATNAELKYEVARYKIQEQRIEISQEKYDKLEKCYQKSVYQEQCLTRKINALHLSSTKQVTTLNDEISDLNKQLSKERSSISSLMEEKKKLKHDFKTREEKFLDKEVDLEAKIKDLENILLKRDQTVKRLQAQLRDLMGKSSDTPSASNTLDPLNQKLESKIVELEFQVLKAWVFENTFESMNNTSGRSVTPHVDKPKLSAVTPHSKKLHASMPSHFVPQPREFNVVKHKNVIVPRMFKINPSQTPRPKGNTRNARVPSASKSSEVKKNVTVEDHRRTLLLSKNQKTMSSECNNINLAIRNNKLKIVCDTCKQCLVLANHDACLPSSVNALNYCANKLCANVPLSANQNRHRTQKFLGTVSFENDHIAAILGYGDLKWRNITITRVYFVEGLGHNLFSVGQFYDVDLEVAFKRNTCFIRDLDGVDLLKGSRFKNIYTINLYDMASASPICLMARNDLISGLPKFKYAKEHLCPSCEQRKSKRASHRPKPVPNSKQRLHLLHMDLCGLMRLASINGKRYVLVIVDDYSRYTWVHFLRTKDETPEVIKNFLKKIYVRLQAPVIIVPKRVVKRKNRTLVEAARTMLIFSHASLFLWAEAIATACYTQNRSIIHRRFNKTPYELIQGKKPDISYLYVFGALCYSKNDCDDIGKLGAKGDIGFFIEYSANSVAYRVYNRRTKKIMETMNVTFDELLAMVFEQNSSRPGLQSMTSGQISSKLELTNSPSTITPQRPSERDLDILFEPLHNEYLGGRLPEAP
nr:hypothetical protein [Tanacetum cinerariifolium]